MTPEVGLHVSRDHLTLQDVNVISESVAAPLDFNMLAVNCVSFPPAVRNFCLPGYSNIGYPKGNSYDPVSVIPDMGILPLSTRLSAPPHQVGGLHSQMNFRGWQHKLYYETDEALRDYLFYGVRDGFIIVDLDAEIQGYDCPNYISPSSGAVYDFVNGLISHELDEQRYVRAPYKPTCIHAIGAVPKPDGKFRAITDCRQPVGSSINNHMSTTCNKFSYKSVDDVCNIMYPGCYMASVDISSAYRSVSIHPQQWKYQGVRWMINGSEKLLFDVRVYFGASNAPYLFTQKSNFVTRCMGRRGFDQCVNYLDDFIVFGDSFQSCQQAQCTLISILISLGFEIAWKKCSSPSQSCQYLGINFDAINMQISLPPHKVLKLSLELEFFRGRSRATK